MRVFVTGASGWIGSAVVPELIDAGHQVTRARPLGRLGRRPHRRRGRGAPRHLDDLDSLRDAAAASDGVIHLAFKHDIAFSGGFQARPMPIAAPSRRSARRSRVPAGRSSSPPGRSGSHPGGWRPNGTSPGSAAHLAAGRGPGDTPRRLLALAARGVRSSVVRLPPTVHGDGDHGFMATPGRHRPRQGRLRLHRRRVQPLARRAPARRRAPVPPGAGAGPGGIGAARGRRRGRADPRHRRGDRPPPRPAGGRHRPRGRGRALRLAGRLPRRSTARPRAR